MELIFPQSIKDAGLKQSVNLAIFECPPALQTWALSHILSDMDNFRNNSIYCNID